MGNDSDSDSDYNVEYYIRPSKVSVPLVNDESADLLGNFDDTKRKNIEIGAYNNVEDNPFADQSDDDEEQEEEDQEDEEEEQDEVEKSNIDGDDIIGTTDNVNKRKAKGDATNQLKKQKLNNGTISNDQMTELLSGSRKTSNRLVLYVTNLNFGTSKEGLVDYFSKVGSVKTVRIPKKRKGGFAFVEMNDMESFQKAFSLHNTVLDERPIKVQLSEAGKKKSANKKNILKQKNRKLAEMRNESKSFTKSGKNYNKLIKKEIEKEKIQQTKMWERRKARRNKKKLT